MLLESFCYMQRQKLKLRVIDIPTRDLSQTSLFSNGQPLHKEEVSISAFTYMRADFASLSSFTFIPQHCLSKKES